MVKVFNYLVNILYVITILFVVVVLTTYAFLRKTEIFNSSTKEYVIGTVIKGEVPIFSNNNGVIKRIYVDKGEVIIRGEKLLDISYDMEGSGSGLIETISSQLNGVVKTINEVDGNKVKKDTKIATLYSNDNMKVLILLTEDQFEKLKEMEYLEVFSKRLDQAFPMRVGLLQPEERGMSLTNKKIGVYLAFFDTKEAASLLNNESVIIFFADKSSRENISSWLEKYIPIADWIIR